jgi:hypothetical protein
MKGVKHRGEMLRVSLSEWPQVDISTLTGRRHTVALARFNAVELYAQGYAHADIFSQTGIPRQELSRLFTRCQSLAVDGEIFGYRALIPGCNIQGYTRKTKVVPVLGENGAGYSGALAQLFDRFKGLEQYIRGEFLRNSWREKHQHVRISIEQLHGHVITWLQEQGLKADEWPLNTKTEGIETLRRYCKNLIRTHERSYLAARSGANAVINSAIGTGHTAVFKSARPFTAVQLDFHKIDAASIITVTNPFGVNIDVPLPRWHIGLLLEERLELILGAVVALEITPSSDSVLETIEAALMPVLDQTQSTAIAIGMSGKIFPNQIMQQLHGQGFGIIRMDNGWSNIAFSVIENIIDVLGAAVNFGPVRAWWARSEIERVFGRLTRAALQCSPSTYGTGPSDSRRTNPEQMAITLKILLTDLIRALEGVISTHNGTRSEGVLMGSSMAALAAAVDNPNSLFIPSPIPNSSHQHTDEQGLMMYKVLHATVRGSLKKGERPYIKVGRWRYTNARMAHDFSLIGTRLKLYCSLRDARVIYATNVTTSESLGRLSPPARWANTRISFRMRSLYFCNGRSARRKERREGKGHEWMQNRSAAPVSSKPGATDAPSSNDALAIAKQALEDSRVEAASENDPQHVPSPLAPRESPTFDFNDMGLFNLDSLPIPRNK